MWPKSPSQLTRSIFKTDCRDCVEKLFGFFDSNKYILCMFFYVYSIKNLDISKTTLFIFRISLFHFFKTSSSQRFAVITFASRSVSSFICNIRDQVKKQSAICYRFFRSEKHIKFFMLKYWLIFFIFFYKIFLLHL